MTTRKELKSALARRYRISSRVEKGRILDEFVAITGYHRKHAMRLVRCDPDGSQTAGRRNRSRIYQDVERDALIPLWEAADRVCGKRLKALRRQASGEKACLGTTNCGATFNARSRK